MVRSRRPRVHPTRFLRERPRSLWRISTAMENSILRLPETETIRSCFSNNTTAAGTASLHHDLAGDFCVVFRVFRFQGDLAGCLGWNLKSFLTLGTSARSPPRLLPLLPTICYYAACGCGCDPPTVRPSGC